MCSDSTSNSYHSLSSPFTLFNKYQGLQPSPSLSIRCTVDSRGGIDFHQRWHLLCALPSHCLNHLTGPSHLNWIRCQTLKWWADPLLFVRHEYEFTDIIATAANKNHSHLLSSGSFIFLTVLQFTHSCTARSHDLCCMFYFTHLVKM